MEEKNENGKRSQDGWYKHKETGAIVHLIDDPKFGVPLTNAYIRAGFVPLTNAYIRAGFTFVGKEDPRVVSDKTNKKDS